MNHKRGRPKNRRAGCLLCKAWKVNGAKCPSKASEQRIAVSGNTRKLCDGANEDGGASMAERQQATDEDDQWLAYAND